MGSSAVKLTISKMLTMVISMVVSMLLSRFRTLDEYGTYSQMMLVINLVTAIFMLGLPNSINYFLAKEENIEGQRRFIATYYSFSTILSVLAGILLVLCIPLIVKYFNNPYIESFAYFMAIYPWTRIILNGIDNMLIVFHKTSLLLAFRLLNSLLLLLNVILVGVLSLGFREYMLFLVLSESLCTLLVYLISFSLVKGFKFSIDFKYVKNILGFTLPIGMASVVGTLCTEFDKLFIGHVYDTEQMAIYSNAAKELPVTIIATSIAAVVMPQIVKLVQRGNDIKAIELWKHSVALSYIFICFIVTGVTVYARDVISILYSEKYVSGVPVFIIYSLILLLRCTYFGTMLNAKGKTRFIFYSSIITLVLNIILNFICYAVFGFIGPAIASFLSMLVTVLLQLRYTASVYKIPYCSVFPWKAISKITVINIIVGAVFWYLKKIVTLDKYIGSEWESVALGVLWGAVYILLMYKYIKSEWTAFNSGEEG